MIDLVRNNINTISDIKDELLIFFDYSIDNLNNEIIKKSFNDEIINFLNEFIDALSKIESMTSDDFKSIINSIKSNNNNISNVWKPIRISLTNSDTGSDISKVAEILGPLECIKRIKLFLSHYDN